ncbi:hypothetical protein KCU92_g3, partial [Aureobasidium melanogenum]
MSTRPPPDMTPYSEKKTGIEALENISTSTSYSAHIIERIPAQGELTMSKSSNRKSQKHSNLHCHRPGS